MSDLLTFRRFNTASEAAEIVEILQEHNIPVKYEEEVLLMDPLYIGQHFDRRHVVKIPAEYFTATNNLITDLIQVSLDDVSSDYYLLSFSTDELKDIIEKKDEWGDYDYVLAKLLLEKRGVAYTSEQVLQVNAARREMLSSDKKRLPAPLLIFGFFSPVIWFLPVPYSIVIGSFGMFIGGFAWLTKKTLPDGTREYAYTEASRSNGKLMLLFGVAIFLSFIAYFIYYIKFKR